MVFKYSNLLTQFLVIIGASRHKQYNVLLQLHSRALAKGFYQYKLEKAYRYLWLGLLVQCCGSIFNTANAFRAEEYFKVLILLHVWVLFVIGLLVYRYRRKMLIYIVHFGFCAKYLTICYNFENDWNSSLYASGTDLHGALIARYFVYMLITLVWHVLFIAISSLQFLFTLIPFLTVNLVTISRTIAKDSDSFSIFLMFVIIQILTVAMLYFTREL